MEIITIAKKLKIVRREPQQPGCMQNRQNFRCNPAATNPEEASATSGPSSWLSPYNRSAPEAEAGSTPQPSPPLAGTAPIRSIATATLRPRTPSRGPISSVLFSPASAQSVRGQRTRRIQRESCRGAPPWRGPSPRHISRNPRAYRRVPPAHQRPPPCAESASPSTARTRP
ncbi:hypothetical protein V8G54_003209 [Vigna mungo]|uniref:Uncharacterized protein n=1 Tax=Vigna mungo TaxID=3915 RepID=A0AAQ3PCR8_VIGMU